MFISVQCLNGRGWLQIYGLNLHEGALNSVSEGYCKHALLTSYKYLADGNNTVYLHGFEYLGTEPIPSFDHIWAIVWRAHRENRSIVSMFIDSSVLVPSQDRVCSGWACCTLTPACTAWAMYQTTICTLCGNVHQLINSSRWYGKTSQHG